MLHLQLVRCPQVATKMNTSFNSNLTRMFSDLGYFKKPWMHEWGLQDDLNTFL